MDICKLNPDPNISVIIDADGAIPVLGFMYSLTCNIARVERLNGTVYVAYQWFKNRMTVSDLTLRNLSFTSLTIYDVGIYTCQITVISSILTGPLVANSSVENVRICKAASIIAYSIHMVTPQYRSD